MRHAERGLTTCSHPWQRPADHSDRDYLYVMIRHNSDIRGDGGFGPPSLPGAGRKEGNVHPQKKSNIKSGGPETTEEVSHEGEGRQDDGTYGKGVHCIRGEGRHASAATALASIVFPVPATPHPPARTRSTSRRSNAIQFSLCRPL